MENHKIKIECKKFFKINALDALEKIHGKPFDWWKRCKDEQSLKWKSNTRVFAKLMLCMLLKIEGWVLSHDTQ